MSDPKAIDMAVYDYELPPQHIAQYPLPQRDQSKLLLYRDGSIADHRFSDLPTLLPSGSLLVGNRTRVIPARIRFQLESGVWIEVFCLSPVSPHDYQLNLSSHEAVRWQCLIGGNRKWKSGVATLRLGADTKESIALTIERIEHCASGDFLLDFRWSGADLSWGDVLLLAGAIPLPPYLNRPAEAEDSRRYQTVFARQEGSVAAPTAGLHFTPSVMEQLAEHHMEWAEVVLHVGAGTFRPVTAENLGGHDMHREYIELDRPLLQSLLEALAADRPIVCVGTTSLRCLESSYYIGRMIAEGTAWPEDHIWSVDQWSGLVQVSATLSPYDAIAALLEELDRRDLDRVRAQTQLLIAPGLSIRMADGLITNFHQPRSTLLLIVAAICGEDWKRIYSHALQQDYRFLSYGDSSLLWAR